MRKLQNGDSKRPDIRREVILALLHHTMRPSCKLMWQTLFTRMQHADAAVRDKQSSSHSSMSARAEATIQESYK